MAATSALVPLVANIHWDDIARQFILRISEELELLQGNKRASDRFDLLDLAQVIAKILEIWTFIAVGEDMELRYPVGDLAPVIAAMEAFMLAPIGPTYPAAPAPYNDIADFDPTGFVTPTTWGITP